ncbi:MAG: hypothetical protein AB4062_12060 [Crocosphaera sp.]
MLQLLYRNHLVSKYWECASRFPQKTTTIFLFKPRHSGQGFIQRLRSLVFTIWITQLKNCYSEDRKNICGVVGFARITHLSSISPNLLVL